MLRKSVGLGFHVQVDFCSHPLLILFGQDGRDQSQAAGSIGKQSSHTRSALEILVQALKAVGRTRAYSVFWRQTKHSKTLRQIRLGPGRQLGMRTAPAINCQAQQAARFIRSRSIEAEVGLWLCACLAQDQFRILHRNQRHSGKFHCYLRE